MPSKHFTRFLYKLPTAAIIARRKMERTATRRISLFREHLEPGCRILDIGVGMGAVSSVLMKDGFSVRGVDVADMSVYDAIHPTLYNGTKLPYKSKSFDVGLLICVLHHCSEQETVLAEALRVCRKVIIIEDTYRNTFEKQLVGFRDNLLNLEFYQHPYRKASGWKTLFRRLRARLERMKEWTNFDLFLYGRQVMFILMSS